MSTLPDFEDQVYRVVGDLWTQEQRETWAEVLRRVYRDGRAAGLREAAERVNRQLNHDVAPCETCLAFDDIERRAEAIESGASQ